MKPEDQEEETGCEVRLCFSFIFCIESTVWLRFLLRGRKYDIRMFQVCLKYESTKKSDRLILGA